jgi:hypothetical protein
MSPFELPAARTGRLADPAPDPDGLRRAVVEHVRLRQVLDLASVLVLRVLQPVRASDDLLGWDAVDLIRGRPHEVAISAGGDVVREAVRLQEA